MSVQAPTMQYIVRIRSGLGTFEDRSRVNDQGHIMPLFLQGDAYARVDAEYANYLAASVEPGYLDIQPLYGEYQSAVEGGLPDAQAPIDPMQLFAKMASGVPLEPHEQAAMGRAFMAAMGQAQSIAPVNQGTHPGDMTNTSHEGPPAPPQWAENGPTVASDDSEALIDGGSVERGAGGKFVRGSNKPKVAKGTAQAELAEQRALEAQQGG